MIHVTVGRKYQNSNILKIEKKEKKQKALYTQEQDDMKLLRICSLSVTGHAGLETAGQDVLCAAVSVLCENLAHSLQALLPLVEIGNSMNNNKNVKRNWKSKELKIQKAKGLLSIDLAIECADNASELLFNAVLLGLNTLAQQYPQHLQLEDVVNGS